MGPELVVFASMDRRAVHRPGGIRAPPERRREMVAPQLWTHPTSVLGIVGGMRGLGIAVGDCSNGVSDQRIAPKGCSMAPVLLPWWPAGAVSFQPDQWSPASARFVIPTPVLPARSFIGSGPRRPFFYKNSAVRKTLFFGDHVCPKSPHASILAGPWCLADFCH